ncbi:uncharacterized protein BDR25DRAFT_358077 [Lindgomyces ingoldianus]|uniref:Uncharacterized protein n=1 Tax=Lindgomyces ingoldianus TaxID=673940 RepID=A0ACB6QLB3_9PLEO|nr:uncharacterized protein BDR25DRAFT_358077 [Lindgomyces ingoldianus]KAF2467804.1 hypothetical protein BDR25DRAFT_358077 [Lindgomyces ingoldianus]
MKVRFLSESGEFELKTSLRSMKACSNPRTTVLRSRILRLGWLICYVLDSDAIPVTDRLNSYLPADYYLKHHQLYNAITYSTSFKQHHNNSVLQSELRYWSKLGERQHNAYNEEITQTRKNQEIVRLSKGIFVYTFLEVEKLEICTVCNSTRMNKWREYIWIENRRLGY